jgi:hypothetical protein
MKTVKMHRAHDVRTSPHSMRHYRARPEPYENVLEAHADAIVAAGAGEIIDTSSGADDATVAARSNKRRRRA